MKNENQIKKEIMDQLDWEPFLNASNINVTVKNGSITLTGHVDSKSKKILAEKAVNKVSSVRALSMKYRGVQFISNLIDVIPKISL